MFDNNNLETGKRLDYNHPFFTYQLGEFHEISPFFISLYSHRPNTVPSVDITYYDDYSAHTEFDVLYGFWDIIIYSNQEEIHKFLDTQLTEFTIWKKTESIKEQDFLDYTITAIWNYYEKHRFRKGFSVEKLLVISDWIRLNKHISLSTLEKLNRHVKIFLVKHPTHKELFAHYENELIQEPVLATTSSYSCSKWLNSAPPQAVIALYYYYLHKTGYLPYFENHVKSKHQALVEAAEVFGVSHNRLEQLYNKIDKSATNRIAPSQVKNINAVIDMLENYPKAAELAKQELKLAEAKS